MFPGKHNRDPEERKEGNEPNKMKFKTLTLKLGYNMTLLEFSRVRTIP